MSKEDREISALLEQWRQLRYEDRLESYYYLRDLNDAREAAAQAEPSALPEALWDLATWRERAEALLSTLRSLEPGAQIEPEQDAELYLLSRAHAAYAPWQRLRSRPLIRQLHQALEIRTGQAPSVASLIRSWSQLSDADRVEMYHLARDLNRTRRATCKADRRARKACGQTRRQTQRS